MSNSTITISDSWTSVPLGELVRVEGSQIKPWSTPDKAFNYISLEDIEAGTGRILNLQPTLGREIASAKSHFQRGDLLYGRLRPYLQKVVIAPSDGVAATELMVLRVKNSVDPEFLQEALLGPDHKAQVTQLMSGARMPRIRSEQLLDLPILLPPRDTQRQIARALAVLRRRFETLRPQIVKALVLAEQFEQTFLKDAFNGRLSTAIRGELNSKGGKHLLGELRAMRRTTWEHARNLASTQDQRGSKGRYPDAATPDVDDRFDDLPATWAWASLSEMGSAVHPLCYGVVEPGEDVEKGVPLVRVQDLEAGGINPARMRQVSETIDQRYARSRLRGGEVLISLVGTVVGQVARVPSELAGANIARAIAKVTPVDPGLDEWIALALQSPALQGWLTGNARGVAQNTLNLSRLTRAPIPLAPSDERTWLLKQIRGRRTSLSSLRGKLEDMQLALDTLWMNVRTRVLVGTTVLPDPGDEAVNAARAVRMTIEEGRREGARGKAKRVTATKLKSGDPADRQDLQAVLGMHPEGLEPLRLLEEAGYGLQDIEAFFKALAEAVAAGRVHEQRSAADWPVLVAV